MEDLTYKQNRQSLDQRIEASRKCLGLFPNDPDKTDMLLEEYNMLQARKRCCQPVSVQIKDNAHWMEGLEKKVRATEIRVDDAEEDLLEKEKELVNLKEELQHMRDKIVQAKEDKKELLEVRAMTTIIKDRAPRRTPNEPRMGGVRAPREHTLMKQQSLIISELQEAFEANKQHLPQSLIEKVEALKIGERLGSNKEQQGLNGASGASGSTSNASTTFETLRQRLKEIVRVPPIEPEEIIKQLLDYNKADVQKMLSSGSALLEAVHQIEQRMKSKEEAAVERPGKRASFAPAPTTPLAGMPSPSTPLPQAYAPIPSEPPVSTEYHYIGGESRLSGDTMMIPDTQTPLKRPHPSEDATPRVSQQQMMMQAGLSQEGTSPNTPGMGYSSESFPANLSQEPKEMTGSETKFETPTQTTASESRVDGHRRRGTSRNRSASAAANSENRTRERSRSEDRGRKEEEEPANSEEEADAAMQRAMLKAEDLLIFTRTRKKQGARNLKEQDTRQTQEHEVSEDPNAPKQ